MFRGALTGLMTALAGCATVVTPPPAPAAPARVFIVDYGRHSSVVLPREEGGELREYAYGQWQWFALGNDEGLRALSILWPGTGALGRRDLPPAEDAAALSRAIAAESIHEVDVERQDAAALLGRLDDRFESARATLVRSEQYQLDFVHDEAD